MAKHRTLKYYDLCIELPYGDAPGSYVWETWGPTLGPNGEEYEEPWGSIPLEEAKEKNLTQDWACSMEFRSQYEAEERAKSYAEDKGGYFSWCQIGIQF